MLRKKTRYCYMPKKFLVGEPHKPKETRRDPVNWDLAVGVWSVKQPFWTIRLGKSVKLAVKKMFVAVNKSIDCCLSKVHLSVCGCLAALCAIRGFQSQNTLILMTKEHCPKSVDCCLYQTYMF